MPESDQVALYFLFSEEEDGSGRKVYVGQTGDLRARLAKHHKEKEFWEKALVRKRPVKAPVVFCLREARCDFTRRHITGSAAICGANDSRKPLCGKYRL